MNIQASQILELVKSQWRAIPEEYMIVLYLAATIFAFLNCFMGYRLRKVWGCLLGILAGAGGGAAAGYYLLEDRMMALVCGGAGAVILGFLAWVLYKFSVFFMCTGLIYVMIVAILPDPSLTPHIIALIVGVFGGTLALGYEKQMVIGITSICGGVGGIHFLLGMTGTEAGMGKWILGAILAAIGMVVQASPFLRGKDLEGKLFGFSSKKKKKVVKKTKTTPGKRESSGSKRKKYEEDDEEDFDEYYEEEPRTSSFRQEELRRTQEYHFGQGNYEAEQKRTEAPYLAPGIGIDLDDLNRELSQEIQKIYHEE